VHEQNLVRVTKYSNRIKELPITKRIAIDYPLLCQADVAKKLAIIAEKLPTDLFLQIDSAYRTKKTERILWDSRKNIIPGLVNNPDESKSSHNTGGAVDVSFANADGIEINLSEPFQKYYQEPQLISDNISRKAQELRQLLNKLMLEQNFVAHPKEYWHFSYGDNRWAEQTRNKTIYEEIDLQTNQYFSLCRRVYYRILKKAKKLINKLFRIHTNI